MNYSFITSIIWCFGCMLLLDGCAGNPYAKTNRQYKKQVRKYAKSLRAKPAMDLINPAPYWVGTTNLNMRKPNFVIIHHTAQKSCDQTLRTFTLPRTQVSAHYVICKDGTVHHMLNDYLRAWHGGIGSWGNLTDINSASIGIELDNDGKEAFPINQINSLLRVLDTLKRKFSIPVNNFIGHADIAPTRKNDPNIFFPWKELADKGFGLWYGDTTNLTVPENFDQLQALRLIGYQVKDSTAAIKAFKRKFMQDTIPVLNESDRKVLFLLFEKL